MTRSLSTINRAVQLGVINEEQATRDILRLPEWFYQSVIDRSLILTIDPAYFRLTGGIERWLYRVARKHAGHQPDGWAFEISHLHEKSGSLARSSDFALDLRRIAARQPLPGYRLEIEWEDRRELVRFRPENLSTVPVDNHVEPIGRLGANSIGTLGANRAAHFIEESNKESSLTVSVGVKNAPSATRDQLASDRACSQQAAKEQSRSVRLPWIPGIKPEDTP
jgi:Plasmid replication initiator protein